MIESIAAYALMVINMNLYFEEKGNAQCGNEMSINLAINGTLCSRH